MAPAMSMIGNFRRASDERLQSLLADPETIDAYLFDDEGDADDALKGFIAGAAEAAEQREGLLVYVT